MKVRCIKDVYNFFTVGKIYEVKNNSVKSDGMHTFNFYGSIEEFNKNLSAKFELVKEEPIKLSKENKKIVKEVEEQIAVLENAKSKHLETVKRIDKQVADLKLKKDKHMVEEVKEITLADIEDKFGCKVKIVKEK